MLCKKLWKEDILHLVLLLSLLRIDRNADWGYGAPLIEVGSHDRSSPVTWSRNIYDYEVSPKNYESMLSNYERWVFHDLNLLGRYSPIIESEDVTAYMGLTPDEPSGPLSEPSTSGMSNRLLDFDNEVDFYNIDFSLSELGSPRDWSQEFPDPYEEQTEGSDSDLTQEDMELIEVLWKQDVDMGFSLEEFQEAAAQAAIDQSQAAEESKSSSKTCSKPDFSSACGSSKPSPNSPPIKEEGNQGDDVDLWFGLPYTIDLETGEYILKRECESPAEVSDNEPPSSGIPEDDFSLEEALQLVGINDDSYEAHYEEISRRVEENAESEEPEVPNQRSLDEQLRILQDMLQAPSPAYYHRALQGHPPGSGPSGLSQSPGGYMVPNSSVPVSALSQSTRGNYGRSSQEQRWQDLASLLGVQPPSTQDYPHHHHYQTNHYPPPPHPASGVSGGSAKLPPSDSTNLYPPPIGMGGNTMNLMTNSSEPMANEPTVTSFKMENPNDMIYYQNGTDPNHNPDGFINSILNEEDLLIDMAMTEGMYTMRMLENGNVGAADSDSAVSSMGSERVPSLSSDTDWMETNSDSGHTPGDHFMAASTDLHSKLRWFDYNYCRQQSGEPGGSNNNNRMPPVAQKKYHLFGKRLFQEQPSGSNSGPSVPTSSGVGSPTGVGGGGGSSSVNNRSPSDKFDYNGINVAPSSSQNTSLYEHPASPLDMVKPQPQEVKYSCSLEFRQNLCGTPRSSPGEAVVHNHTYHLPPEHMGVLQRPLTRDKRGKRSSEEDLSISRDERRARALNIPITVQDIINLPMDEFNERLSKYDLSESQLSLIRDIRRRGKNKVAAQNCRKRKLDQIMCLADEVKIAREKKQRLLQERDSLLQERMRVKSTVSQLFRHIFQSMRDEDGNSYSPHDWSLEESPDGSIMLVRRDPNDLSQRSSQMRSIESDIPNRRNSSSSDLHQPSTSKKHLHPRKHGP